MMTIKPQKSSSRGSQPPLWTKDYLLAFASHLFMFFSFYLLIPVMPFYIMEQLKASESLAGIVLSLYTLASLAIRPFSGYMVDLFSRKPLYFLFYVLFSSIFVGYLMTATLSAFIVLRVIHGASFGVSTISANTLAIDLLPAERRAEGISYFGMAPFIALAMAPMVGLFIYNNYSFSTLFVVCLISSCLGLASIIGIKLPPKTTPPIKQKLSINHFVLIKGLPIALVFLLLAVGYGIIINYTGTFSKSIHVGSAAGLFFTIQALGIILGRLLSAKSINRGNMAQWIYIGSICLVVAYLMLVVFANQIGFYAVAIFLGLGFGFVSPAFQNMLINIAPPHQRGAANSTCFTAFDLGITIGIACGGYIIESFGYVALYLFCLSAVLLGVLFFWRVAYHFFRRQEQELGVKG